MNWMHALYATYEQNRDYVGRIDKEPAHGNRKERLITPLLPLYHSMQNAHITITLNKQGRAQFNASPQQSEQSTHHHPRYGSLRRPHQRSLCPPSV